jgi:hypothetical protein
MQMRFSLALLEDRRIHPDGQSLQELEDSGANRGGVFTSMEGLAHIMPLPRELPPQMSQSVTRAAIVHSDSGQQEISARPLFPGEVKVPRLISEDKTITHVAEASAYPTSSHRLFRLRPLLAGPPAGPSGENAAGAVVS